MSVTISHLNVGLKDAASAAPVSSTVPPASPPPSKPPRRSPSIGDLLIQAGALLGVGATIYLLSANAHESLSRQNTASGFGFLSRPAAFDLAESVISFTPSDSFGRAILAGLANTLVVAVAGVILATVLGFLIGFARLSRNSLLAQLSSLYVEWMRNVPLILHLCLWYVLMAVHLPPLRQALQPVEGVFLSNRGLQLPRLMFEGAHVWLAVAGLGGLIAAFGWGRLSRLRREATGRRLPVVVPAALLILVPPLLAYLVTGIPVRLEFPERQGFNFVGGAHLSPEFVALVVGLSTYTAAFIAEIVRAGIKSVPGGQVEAGMSLGLHHGGVMWLIVMPQAMRVITPPLTTQYLNLLKNSSLAVVVGYPDLVSVTNTTLNQTGQAIEGIAIMMAIYLSLSVAISSVMGWVNASHATVER